MINTLTSLRLFFALMVFGAHCYVVDSTFSTHFYKEGFVGVSFFFILSGFIIAYNYQQKLVERKVSKRPVLGGTNRPYLSIAYSDLIGSGRDR